MHRYNGFDQMNQPKILNKRNYEEVMKHRNDKNCMNFSATTTSREYPFPQSSCGFVLYLFVFVICQFTLDGAPEHLKPFDKMSLQNESYFIKISDRIHL